MEKTLLQILMLTFLQTICWTPWGVAQLVAGLEDIFNIEIDPEDILPENFSTINEIDALVHKYKA